MGFDEQQQTAPGVQSQMDPVPDCGETSYRGTGRLTGKHAIVTGGDSGITPSGSTSAPISTSPKRCCRI
jgi:hypothetical protein